MGNDTPSTDKTGNKSQQKPASKSSTGRLMTFKKPTPSLAMARTITPIVKGLGLAGIPGLRSVPGLGRIPGIRGISNVTRMEFPLADKERLKSALSPDNATFVTPNHPEFFTDWLLDNVIIGSIAPLSAYWATHVVVNGMGSLAQRFWLNNNLIAQIPGGAGKAGKQHSIDYALSGYPVLLHPEGNVAWHGDLVAPLFSGAVDMALEAASRAPANRKVLVAPVIWKLKFNRDVTATLHRELDFVENALQLPKTRGSTALAHRVYAAYDELLARDEQKFDVATSTAPYFERHEDLISHLLARLHNELDNLNAPDMPQASDPGADPRDTAIRRGERWLRGTDTKSSPARSVRALTRTLRRLLRFHPNVYPQQQLTQEHIAESIKRIRNDYCTKTTRDMVNKFVPQPAGPRTAHIRVPEPLDISAALATYSSAEIVTQLRDRMQLALDSINQDLTANGDTILEPNPFI